VENFWRIEREKEIFNSEYPLEKGGILCESSFQRFTISGHTLAGVAYFPEPSSNLYSTIDFEYWHKFFIEERKLIHQPITADQKCRQPCKRVARRHTWAA